MGERVRLGPKGELNPPGHHPSAIPLLAHGADPARVCLASPLAVPQHPEHRPERPILLAVDQELAERPRIRVPP